MELLALPPKKLPLPRELFFSPEISEIPCANLARVLRIDLTGFPQGSPKWTSWSATHGYRSVNAAKPKIEQAGKGSREKHVLGSQQIEDSRK